MHFFQPLLKSHENFNAKVDEVCELGTALDQLQKGETASSPVHRSKYKLLQKHG